MRKLLFIFILICLSGCVIKIETPRKHQQDLHKDAKTISDLSYCNDCGYIGTVYIMENEKYVPYLVLTDDYQGSSLLLREQLLEEKVVYNTGYEEYPSYYAGSIIDQYLYDTFSQCFSSELYDAILDEPIEITDKSSFSRGQETIETVPRKVFLLSYAELNNTAFQTKAKEGPLLEYFADHANRIAYRPDGKADSWWLRTPTTSDRFHATSVDPEGVSGSAGVLGLGEAIANGVRPAFRLPKQISVQPMDGSGGEFYTLVLSKDLRE